MKQETRLLHENNSKHKRERTRTVVDRESPFTKLPENSIKALNVFALTEYFFKYHEFTKMKMKEKEIDKES